MRLGDNFQGGATLDHVASALTLNHNAALRWITRASATVDEETRATTHGVGGRRVEFIAIVHTLECLHVAQGICTGRQRTHANLAFAIRVIAAGSGLTAAAASGVDI